MKVLHNSTVINGWQAVGEILAPTLAPVPSTATVSEPLDLTDTLPENFKSIFISSECKFIKQNNLYDEATALATFFRAVKCACPIHTTEDGRHIKCSPELSKTQSICPNVKHDVNCDSDCGEGCMNQVKFTLFIVFLSFIVFLLGILKIVFD